MSTHHAACQCGEVSITCVGDPDFVIICNCKACQRRTGAAFGTGAYFRQSQFEVNGSPKRWARTADTGRSLENFFCGTCGTTLYWTLEMRPNHIGAALGTFDTELPEPARVIWTEKQHPWVDFSDHLPRFQRGSPEPQT